MALNGSNGTEASTVASATSSSSWKPLRPQVSLAEMSGITGNTGAFSGVATGTGGATAANTGVAAAPSTPAAAANPAVVASTAQDSTNQQKIPGPAVDGGSASAAAGAGVYNGNPAPEASPAPGKLAQAMLELGFDVEGFSDTEIAEMIEGLQSQASQATKPASPQSPGSAAGSGMSGGAGGNVGGSDPSTAAPAQQTIAVDPVKEPAKATEKAEPEKAERSRKYVVPQLEETTRRLLQAGVIKKDQATGMFTAPAGMETHAAAVNSYTAATQKLTEDLVSDPYGTVHELAADAIEREVSRIREEFQKQLDERVKTEVEAIRGEKAKEQESAEMSRYIETDPDGLYSRDESGAFKSTEADDGSGGKVAVRELSNRGKVYDATWIAMQEAGITDQKKLHSLALKAAMAVPRDQVAAQGTQAAQAGAANGSPAQAGGNGVGSRRQLLLVRSKEAQAAGDVGGSPVDRISTTPASPTVKGRGRNRMPSLLEMVESGKR